MRKLTMALNQGSTLVFVCVFVLFSCLLVDDAKVQYTTMEGYAAEPSKWVAAITDSEPTNTCIFFLCYVFRRGKLPV